mgnify:CR=1 FL=1
MKKKLAFWLSALLSLACLPVVAFAAETNEMIPRYCSSFSQHDRLFYWSFRPNSQAVQRIKIYNFSSMISAEGKRLPDAKKRGVVQTVPGFCNLIKVLKYRSAGHTDLTVDDRR